MVDHISTRVRCTLEPGIPLNFCLIVLIFRKISFYVTVISRKKNKKTKTRLPQKKFRLFLNYKCKYKVVQDKWSKLFKLIQTSLMKQRGRNPILQKIGRSKAKSTFCTSSTSLVRKLRLTLLPCHLPTICCCRWLILTDLLRWMVVSHQNSDSIF